MSDSRKTGLLRLAHLQEHTEARGEDMAAQAPRFHRLAREDSAPRAVVAEQLFQTPEDLAAQIVDLAGPPFPGLRWLEPSAGLGRIYRAIRAQAPDAPVTLCEVAPDCARELYRETQGDSAARLIVADFLECDQTRLAGPFDRIVMNPPFRNDRRHVRHAISLLAPGGTLVAIVADGPRQRKQLQPLATLWSELPEGSFKTEGTNVNAAIFKYLRPL